MLVFFVLAMSVRACLPTMHFIAHAHERMSIRVPVRTCLLPLPICMLYCL
jgi:hypothetical protein